MASISFIASNLFLSRNRLSTSLTCLFNRRHLHLVDLLTGIACGVSVENHADVASWGTLRLRSTQRELSSLQ